VFNASVGNRERLIVVNKADTVEFIRALSHCAMANGVSRKFSASKNSAVDADYGGG